MEIYYGLPDAPLDGDSTITIGVFDGVHRGHTALIGRAIERAQESGHRAGVVTFDPHPVEVLSPGARLGYLTSIPERARLIESLGADFMLVLGFTHELSQTSARDFVRPLFEKLRMRRLVIGHDFTLGHKRQGNAAFLSALGAEWGFEVEAIRAVRLEDTVSSSTRIRQLIGAGQITAANLLLAREYTLDGALGDDGVMRVPGRRQIPADGYYQCLMSAAGRELPCAAQVEHANIRILRGGLPPGDVSLAFRRDVTAALEGSTEIEHTADVALRVEAASFPELLRQAALGMFALMCEATGIVADGTTPVSVQGVDRETVLVNWLNELLYLHEMNRVIFTDVFPIGAGNDHATGTTFGGPAGEIRKAIKAVTFHDLHVVERDGRLEATIVFDI
ncbi:MAG: archease [Chloroflexi bacterium]|nr:archease [Chloroflexota bacterium]